ncbi:AAA family ATPase [Bacillus sp. UNC41MFS5]|uniref:AAA family ATPase n=1 Tax=Bacillus sp. UNC41MFS5 TaxID=1449046 RepID=UPI0006901112|nr:AAA family ATPase [Bacillus sp. UNC41MFS5]
MTSAYTIAVTDLPKADLKIGAIYEGGTKGNAGDDPLSKLMGCENQGGFRPVGARNGVNTKYCVLYSDLSHDEWSNRIELETGKFYYYGDNRKAGRGIHETAKKGNLILRYSFDEFLDGNRKNVPPFFVFAKGKRGRDVIFRGLAVPGAVDENDSDILKIISHESTEGSIPNYLSIFTILDVKTIKRAWIEDLHKGEPFTENAPDPWLEWINTGKYIPLKEKSTIDYIIDNKPDDMVIEKPEILLSNKDLIDHIHSYIKSKGFHYSREEVINLFLSIKTKPFVILSGISGTGKTKIVQWFAESVGATEENGRFKLIPVRPDWSDSSDLLGYVDIKDDFKPGPLTKVIEKAEKNPDHPYFVLLDEMNLARVEHYFSDILSVMESRKKQGEEIVTSTLLSAETAKRDIKLPTNLYIIGTVNMDETTHPFSKKVLDRANTIEFNRVELTNLSFLEEGEEVQPIAVTDIKFRANYLHLKDLYGSNKALVEKVTVELETLNKSLQVINAHVGYRVRDEICFYLDYNENSNLMDFKVAFDHCILQKILPRISGSDKRVERLLSELYHLFTGRKYIENLESYEEELKQAKYRNSATKVLEMLRRLKDDGFTSFWIS